MTKKEQFIDVLRSSEMPITISEWATKIVEEYPSILKQINGKTNETMTLKSLASSISLKVSKGEFSDIKVLDTKPYRQVMYVSENKKNDLTKKELQKDVEYLLIEEKKNEDIKKSREQERYRLEELENIMIQLNRYFSLNFELHHIYSLSSGKKEAKHHIDNLQLLTKEHRLLAKNKLNRFSIEEQKAYIKRVIVLHMMINKQIDISLIDEVLEMLLERLGKVY